MSAYRTLFSIQKAARIFWALGAFSAMNIFGILETDAASSSQFAAVNSKNSPSKHAPQKVSQPSKAAVHKKSPNAQKQEQKHIQTSSKPSGTGPIILEKSGQWTVYSAQQHGKKLCYAMTRPIQRLPKAASSHQAHLFVSTRPSEGVRNEVNITLGTPLKEEDPKAQITIGSHIFPLTLKESYGWIKNVNEEKNAVVAMQKNKEVIVKVQSRKGMAITDHYSLKGLSQALARVQKECP